MALDDTRSLIDDDATELMTLHTCLDDDFVDDGELNAASCTGSATAGDTGHSGDAVTAYTRAAWPAAAWYILVVELCERYAYYSATVVLYPYARHQLGFSQGGANATYSAFSFWAYGSCLLGGYVADAWMGRVRSIIRFAAAYALGLAALFASALHPHGDSALPLFWGALFVTGLGTGGIKAAVGPLLADQVQDAPAEVYASIFRWHYWSINVGALFGILTGPAMHTVFASDADADAGGEGNATYDSGSSGSSGSDGAGGDAYWASFLLPLVLFVVAIAIFADGRRRNLYHARAPEGSMLQRCARAAWYSLKERRRRRRDVGDDSPAPSPDAGAKRHWLSYAADSAEHGAAAADLAAALRASGVFLWYPVYWLCYNQMFSNLVAQAELLDRPSWLAPEALNAANPFTLILGIPLFDLVVFPYLRRLGVSPGPLTRIAVGFLLAALSILYCGVLEWFVRQRGSFDGSGEYTPGPDGRISVWVQVPPYALFAGSEIFASIGGLELAYTEAPTSMKCVVSSLYLVTMGGGALLSLATSPVIAPDNMFVVYMAFGGAMLVTTVAFHISMRKRERRKKRG